MRYLFGTNLPVRSSKIRIPRDQKSTLRPWPLFRMISGATYSGVPQNVHVFWPHLIFFAKPKSTLQRNLIWMNYAVFLMIIIQRYQQPVCIAYQFDISFWVQHKVLRLQVSVNNSFFVKVLKRFGHTAHTELGRVLVKTSSEKNVSESGRENNLYIGWLYFC